MYTIRVAKTKASISFAVTPMQIVGFPMRRLILYALYPGSKFDVPYTPGQLFMGANSFIWIAKNTVLKEKKTILYYEKNAWFPWQLLTGFLEHVGVHMKLAMSPLLLILDN